MRVVLFSFLTLIILLKSPWQSPICNFATAKNAIAPRIFAEQTIDGPDQNVLITRILHNKAGIFLSEFGRCYFNVIDPSFIYQSTGIFGVAASFYLMYRIIKKLAWPQIAIITIIPALLFFYTPMALIAFTHKLFAIIGLVFLILQEEPKP